MSEIKQSADSEMMRQTLARDIARELYDRFMMGGWEPEETHSWLEGVLTEFGLLIRQQTAARCAEIARGYIVAAEIRAEFEVKE